MYTDICSHILWGMDNETEKQNETFELLNTATKDHIDKIICTPMMVPGESEKKAELYQENMWIAQDYISSHHLKIRLYRGAENYCNESFIDMLSSNRLIRMAASNTLLVKFNQDDTLDHIEEIIARINDAKVTPIIAHAETYKALKKPDTIISLKGKHSVLIQVNAESLLKEQSLTEKRYWRHMMQEGIVDFVATDTSYTNRNRSCMTLAMQHIRGYFGDAVARRLMENTEKLVV